MSRSTTAPRSKAPKTRKVLPGAEPTLSTQYNHKLIKVPAVARVQIHADAAPSVKDTLVLRSTEGTAKSECTYWKERKVQNASKSDGFLNLSFSPGRNDGTAERARTDRRYTLAWRPGGKKKAEVLLSKDRAYEEVWKTGPDDDPDKIAELMAARFQETADMILPDWSPEVLDGPDTPEPIRESDEEVPDAGAPLPYHGPMPDPETAKSMKSRSGGGGSSRGNNGEGGPALPPGPRWLALLRWEEGTPELVAIYEVIQSGKYKPATVEGEGPGVTVRLPNPLAAVLSHVDLAWTVAEKLTDERQEGLQRVEDPSYLGALGEIAIAIGGAAAGGALGGGVLSVAAIGAASYAAGIPFGWLERWENADEHAASDPLIEWGEGKESSLEDYEGADDSRAALERHGGKEGRWGGWLAEESYWGKHFDRDPSAREALLDLVTPGKDEGASPPPTDPIRRHAEQFTQTAFSFPTAVGVPPRPSVPESNALSASGPPKRLFLSIIPKYLPKKRGTFMVDAQVNTEGRSPVPIQCAVHYVKTSTALRYTVRRKGESLSLPSDTSLSDWADDECWPIGWKEDTPVPGGGVEEKVHFPVHVESGPRMTINSRILCNWRSARSSM
jgi:hypothetical protein